MNHGGAVTGVMRQEAGAELRFGDIERLRIQDGLPVLAEETRKKVRFVE